MSALQEERDITGIMKDLIRDIKTGSFQHVYLLYGEETYLMLQYRDRLVNALLPDGAGMNLTTYGKQGFSEAAVIDQAETLPFFADRRVLRMDDTGLFKSAAELLPDYLKNIPDYCYLIFTEHEVDKRSRMYKAVKSHGRCVEFKEQSEETLKKWILRMLTQNNLKIRSSVMDYLIMKTGTDMNHIRLEVDKLVNYCTAPPQSASVSQPTASLQPASVSQPAASLQSSTVSEPTVSTQPEDPGNLPSGASDHSAAGPDRKLHEDAQNPIEVTKEDIDAVVSDRVENRIFDMITAVTSHNQRRALDLYADLLALKTPPLQILVLIGREFTRLLIIKELSENGYNDVQIASKAGMPSFAVRRSRPIARSYTHEQLEDAIRFCNECDENIKNGSLNDRLAVELVLMRLS